METQSMMQMCKYMRIASLQFTSCQKSGKNKLAGFSMAKPPLSIFGEEQGHTMLRVTLIHVEFVHVSTNTNKLVTAAALSANNFADANVNHRIYKHHLFPRYMIRWIPVGMMFWLIIFAVH